MTVGLISIKYSVLFDIMATETKEIQQQQHQPNQINLENTSFSINFVSIGLLVAAIGWGFRIWLGHDKRLTALETKTDQNTKEIALNKGDVNANYRALTSKIESISGLKSDLANLAQKIEFLSISVSKDFESRNQTIDETKGRVFNLETNTAKVLDALSNLSRSVDSLYTQMAQINPMTFGRRQRDHDLDDPPSRPSS